jgi:Ca2+-binding EF-hand superfamily protein
MEKQKLKLEPWEDEKEEKIYNCFKEIDSDEDDYIPVTD